MASAWGYSWGRAWGNSWGSTVVSGGVDRDGWWRGDWATLKFRWVARAERRERKDVSAPFSFRKAPPVELPEAPEVVPEPKRFSVVIEPRVPSCFSFEGKAAGRTRKAAWGQMRFVTPQRIREANAMILRAVMEGREIEDLLIVG